MDGAVFLGEGERLVVRIEVGRGEGVFGGRDGIDFDFVCGVSVVAAIWGRWPMCEFWVRSGWARVRLAGFMGLLGVVVVSGSAARGPAATELFFDDFAGVGLDRTKWNVEVSGPVYNDELQAYIDSPEVVRVVKGDEAGGAENGALLIEAHYRPGFKTSDGRTFSFNSARLNTRGKFEFANGRAAARMKLPAGSGLWPAFWILGTGNWPETGEIDVMEYVGETDWTSVAIHGPRYSGETPLVNKYFFPKGMDATSWHVYSVDWTPTGFVFWVDDVLIYRATRPMVEHFGPWVFDSPKFLVVNLAVGGIYPLKTNGVRAPFTGLPEATFSMVKEHRAKVLVDWVRVTRE